MLSSIAYNEDEAIVNYCTDQVWTARQHHSRERPAEGILASRRKLFSVLVIHKSPQAILKFINEGISDFHIPISGDTLRQKFPDWTESFIGSFLMVQAQLIFDPPHGVNMLSPGFYTIGWICTRATEYMAASFFLDKRYSLPDGISQYDNTIYTLGRAARRHNIVIAAPLHGNFSTTTTEAVAKDMLKKFPNISLSLMVGISSAMRSYVHDIRLGDVVVGTTMKGYNSVFQYDFDDTMREKKFQGIRLMNQLPTPLQEAVDNIDPTGIKYEGKLSACNYRGQQLKGIIPWGKFTRKLRAKYLRPKPDDFSSALNRRIQRLHLMDEVPVRVHYGPIAFSDQLIKNAVIQEHLIRDKDVVCFDMGTAGLIDYPCLVIRGICQYPNSKLDPSSRFSRTPALDPDSDLDPKSDLDPNSCKTWEIWQDYAAMTAATYANEILRGIPPINIVAVDESGFAAL